MMISLFSTLLLSVGFSSPLKKSVQILSTHKPAAHIEIQHLLFPSEPRHQIHRLDVFRLSPRPGIPRESVQVVELEVKWDEEVSTLTRGYVCKTDKSEAVYAVFLKSKAQKKEKFTPVRAWIVEEGTWRLGRIGNPQMIHCLWQP